MCGRFTLTFDLEQLFNRFNIAYPAEFNLDMSYNIAPSQEVVAVVKGHKGNKIGKLRWGLVPSWAKDPSIGHKMINARSETAPEKPSFCEPLQKRRCLVIADGFYEWKKIGGQKQPYYIYLKDRRVFAFAGLWSVWKQGGERLSTCTILTTKANTMMADLHHRMPVILNKEQEKAWLNPQTELNQLKTMMISYPSEEMDAHPVSDAVNSPKNNSYALTEPLINK
ncbi:SOS response-associated peptidase [Tuberibacillus sp. Marseille-P3662]|uniref:SOS response-associated peptidase n=1 Tax=Tuberibacillus sp. Marseille-P3662 TaxID=1965358 RepID=UPI000A1CBCE2|nr:SOS response-associated peptidase [Tuberibacillus sp. Marseille-P3662]